MGKGLSIAALVIAILALFVPLLSIFVSLMACLLALCGALMGEKPLALATALIVLFNTYLFSPINWLALASDGGGPIRLATVLSGAILLVVLARSLIDNLRRPRAVNPPRIRH